MTKKGDELTFRTQRKNKVFPKLKNYSAKHNSLKAVPSMKEFSQS
jgi:hypothetical protein